MITRSTENNENGTTQRWLGKAWEITVEHGKWCEGYSHGHRRIIEALNRDLGECTAQQRAELGLERLAPTLMSRELEDGPSVMHWQQPASWVYRPARSEGAQITLTTRGMRTPARRVSIMLAALDNDDVHPRVFRSRGVDRVTS